MKSQFHKFNGVNHSSRANKFLTFLNLWLLIFSFKNYKLEKIKCILTLRSIVSLQILLQKIVGNPVGDNQLILKKSWILD